MADMPQKSLNIIYMGTPDFAVPALNLIHNSGHNVVAVYTQPPRPKGRGHQVQKSPVHIYADAHGLAVHHPVTLKGGDDQAIFSAHDADIAVVAAYGLLLPQVVLDAPRFGCINIHASLLPRWRGASPIQHAIWHGDATSGVTIMQMDKGLDTGPEISKRSIALDGDTTAQSLHDALSALGGEMVIDALRILSIDDTLSNTPQNDADSTYAPLLKKSDGRIDWSQNARDIDAQIRALNPWPATYCGDGNARIKIPSARLSSEISDAPIGTVLDKLGHIVCADKTVLQIKTLQSPGKKAMDFQSALNGGYIKIGEQLS